MKINCSWKYADSDDEKGLLKEAVFEMIPMYMGDDGEEEDHISNNLKKLYLIFTYVFPYKKIF